MQHGIWTLINLLCPYRTQVASMKIKLHKFKHSLFSIKSFLSRTAADLTREQNYVCDDVFIIMRASSTAPQYYIMY